MPDLALQVLLLLFLAALLAVFIVLRLPVECFSVRIQPIEIAVIFDRRSSFLKTFIFIGCFVWDVEAGYLHCY